MQASVVSRLVAAAVLVAALTGCSVEYVTSPNVKLLDFRGSLTLTGQVVRDGAASDTPIPGITLYLYAPVAPGTKGAQWIDVNSGTSFYARRGFWAVPVAGTHSSSDGSFSMENLKAGGYVLRVVPDILKGCSTGAVMSIQITDGAMEPLQVRAS